MSVVHEGDGTGEEAALMPGGSGSHYSVALAEGEELK